MKPNNLNRAFMVLSVLAFLILLQGSYVGITGYNTADVSIKEKNQGSILIGYNRTINLTNPQVITAEFVNIGTTNFSSRIEVSVYIYNNDTGSLDDLAAYYDGYSTLFPGERKSFRVAFLPMKTGTYYIKVRVPYGTKVAESWASFFVTYTYEQVQEVIFIPTSYGGGTTPAQREYGTTDMTLDFNASLELYPGERTIFPVTVSNTGTINIHSVTFYSTTTDSIDFEANPKQIYELRQNRSVMFLVSLNVSESISPGAYDFFFEVKGDEIKKSGSIKLNILPFNVSIEKEVQDAILNYEYLIARAGREAYITRLEGFNTSRAEGYLDDARHSLQRAKDMFGEGDYEGAKDVLDFVKRDLEKVVFELATISVRIYSYPAYSPLLILPLLLIIAIAILILFFIYKKRKRDRKPKLIRDYEEEENK